MSIEAIKSNPEINNANINTSAQDDFPPFDPIKAQRLRNGEKSEGDTFSAEDLKETNKMIAKLEQMGAKSEIINNPAFQRILENKISMWGLGKSEYAEITDSKDKSLDISGAGRKGDASQHNRSNMNLRVNDDGSVLVECAYVDRESIKRAYTDYGYDITELENAASTTEFNIKQDGSLHSTEKRAYESQIVPESNPSGKFSYYGNLMKEERTFDKDGNEQLRIHSAFKPKQLEGRDYLTPHLGRIENGNTPERASFNGLRTLRNGLEPNEIFTYERQSDETINVTYARKNEAAVPLGSIPLNTQYGTHDLIPAPGAIEAELKKRGMA